MSGPGPADTSLQCGECQRHEAAHRGAIADDPPDPGYLQLNLAGWLSHMLEDHLGAAPALPTPDPEWPFGGTDG